MKLNGHLDVYMGTDNYLHGVIKAFSAEKELLGKCFVEVRVPEDKKSEFKQGTTYTLIVTNGYLDAMHVECEKPFTKLLISVKDYEVVKTFSPKAKKPAKKGGK